MAARRIRSRHGFTIIEIMAVVLIIGLTFGFFLPNIEATRGRRLEDQAKEVAALLRVARERAVVTNAAHWVFLDLEEGSMHIEWYVDEERAQRAFGEEPEPEPPTDPALLAGGRAKVSLDPPDAKERDYYAIPSKFGEVSYLPLDYFFIGLEGPDGFFEEGDAWLVFGRDGTTDYTEIWMGDAWDNEVMLEVQPLMDRVRIHRGKER